MKVYRTSGNEICTGSVGQLAIIVSGNKSYSDEAWGEYLHICRQMSDPAAPFVGAYNYSPIVGPSAAQRKVFDSELGDLNRKFKRVVVVSDSAFVRGALTASAWLTRSDMQMRPFSPAQTNNGFDWLAQEVTFPMQEAQALLRELVRQQGDDPVSLLSR
jgi:hypothetical protein